MKLLKITAFVLLFSAAAYLFNIMVIYNIVIPDPCYYHSHEPGFIFNAFYKMTAGDGFHPTETIFNKIISICIGAISSIAVIQNIKYFQK